jgi:hypothetical protein
VIWVAIAAFMLGGACGFTLACVLVAGGRDMPPPEAPGDVIPHPGRDTSGGSA